MRNNRWKIGILTASVGIVLTGTEATAQMTGGQAAAARAAAAQTRGGPAAAAPASAPQASASASAAQQQAEPARPSPFAAPRRDPFRPLIVKRTGGELPSRLPAGKAGLVIGQLTVQGIVRGLNGIWIAVVDNKTKRAYFLYERDELYNGIVARITADSVVFEERVTDAADRPRTREVVKRLNPQ